MEFGGIELHMEYDKIKELMTDMGNSKLSAIDIEFPDGTKISMKKDYVKTAKEAEEVVSTNNKEEKANETKEIKGNIVKSPMVGTFYLKPSPTAVPYVEVGKDVKKGDVLCIIEAMKLINEIESEFEGKITEILVKDGEPVEYGTELFVIE